MIFRKMHFGEGVRFNI